MDAAWWLHTASARQQARTRVRASDISEARPVLLAVRHHPTRSIDSDVRTGLVRILALYASATNPPSSHESRSGGRPTHPKCWTIMTGQKHGSTAESGLAVLVGATRTA
jgi:hypothetical protein